MTCSLIAPSEGEESVGTDGTTVGRIFFKIDMLFPNSLAVRMSIFPSESKSAKTTLFGPPPVARSILAAKDKVPGLPVFCKIETVLSP